MPLGGFDSLLSSGHGMSCCHACRRSVYPPIVHLTVEHASPTPNDHHVLIAARFVKLRRTGCHRGVPGACREPPQQRRTSRQRGSYAAETALMTCSFFGSSRASNFISRRASTSPLVRKELNDRIRLSQRRTSRLSNCSSSSCSPNTVAR